MKNFIHAIALLLFLLLMLIQFYTRAIQNMQQPLLYKNWRPQPYRTSMNLRMNHSSLIVNNATKKPNRDWILEEVRLVDDIKEVNYSKKLIKIAVYHPFHVSLKRYTADFDSESCVYKNCHVHNIFNKSRDPVDADAVLFQGNRMPNILPVHRDLDQVFVFIDVECPLYPRFTNIASPKFTNYFNWTMTYRRDSDIPLLYGTVVPRHINVTRFHHLVQLSDALARVNWFADLTGDNPLIYDESGRLHTEATCSKSSHYHSNFNSTVVRHSNNVTEDNSEFTDGRSTSPCSPDGTHKDYADIFRRKTKQAAWMVSHCVTHSKREQYVQAMASQIDIDIYGGCFKLKCPHEQQEQCTEMIAKNYKFYLAFENTMCIDYITEKAFDWLEQDIIIVVRGARNYERHLPVGTYINAEEFSSPEALAKYLLKLGSNEQEYIAFLKRKDLFRVIHEKMRVQTSYCHLCRMLNNVENYRKTINSISYWYEKPGICIKPEDINF